MIKKSNSDNKTMIFFWPSSEFNDVHWKKDPGAIPLGFAKLGYRVIIIVGKMKAIKKDHINIVELNDLFKCANFKILNLFRYYIFSVKTSIKSVRIFIKNDPQIIVGEGLNPTIILPIFTYKFMTIYKKRSKKRKLLIKLDIDPNYIKYVNNKKNHHWFFMHLKLIISSLIFDRIIVESKCAYDELSKSNLSKIYIKKLIVIPDGYINDDIRINKNKKRKKIILSVGRINVQKGFEFLIKSFEIVHKTYSDWKLRIVGPIEDREYYGQLEKLVNSLNLKNSVKLVGGLSEKNLEKEFYNASFFCLLSRFEGFSIVRSEAIAHELPIVTSEAGCGVYYKKYGSIVVPVGDVSKSAKAILKLIKNKRLRERISKTQLKSILTWDEVAKRIDDI